MFDEHLTGCVEFHTELDTEHIKSGEEFIGLIIKLVELG